MQVFQVEIDKGSEKTWRTRKPWKVYWLNGYSTPLNMHVWYSTGLKGGLICASHFLTRESKPWRLPFYELRNSKVPSTLEKSQTLKCWPPISWVNCFPSFEVVRWSSIPTLETTTATGVFLCHNSQILRLALSLEPADTTTQPFVPQTVAVKQWKSLGNSIAQKEHFLLSTFQEIGIKRVLHCGFLDEWTKQWEWNAKSWVLSEV